MAGKPSPSAEDRLPKSLHFAESDVIIGVVRARRVHEVGPRRRETEDRVLLAELPGYRDYAERVRWRLLPGIW